MNPRVSRSSALASKATGFPIAKIAARLAVGYALDEIPNDITRRTPASFEPTIDYAVVKVPRFAFEKFPMADGGLTTQMKSVGEAMAIGRTFKQAFMKALRSRELDVRVRLPDDAEELQARLEVPSHDRYELLWEAVRRGVTRWPRSHDCTHVAPRGSSSSPSFASRLGAARAERIAGRPACASFKSVDTCAAEFEAETPYFYSAYERAFAGGDARDTSCAAAPARRRDPGLGPEPHRAGHRVRLLLRARRDDRARDRPRRRDDQLQPRDGVDRLRHLHPPLLRAAHASRTCSRSSTSSSRRA